MKKLKKWISVGEFAENLKNNETQSEKILKDKLSMIAGLIFKDQHIYKVGNKRKPFIVDFWLPELKTVIEVDGEYHNSSEQKEKDLKRDLIIADKGHKIIRIKNNIAETISMSDLLKLLELDINTPYIKDNELIKSRISDERNKRIEEIQRKITRKEKEILHAQQSIEALKKLLETIVKR